MDSLFAEQLSQSIEMQISVIFRNADKGNGISVTALPVQQQRGSTVCGVCVCVCVCVCARTGVYIHAHVRFVKHCEK